MFQNFTNIKKNYCVTVVKTVCLLFLCYVAVPVIYFQNNPGLDSSWAFGLNYAELFNYKFGTDNFFTYGPLGFIMFAIPIEHNGINLHLLWNIFWVLSLGAILSYMFFSKDMAYYRERKLHICMFTLFSYWGLCTVDSFYVFIELLLISLSIHSSKRVFWFFLACISAVIFLYAKFTIGIIGVGSIFLAIVYFVYHKENIVKEVLLCFVGLPVLFFLTYMVYNPSITGMLQYIMAGFEISSGYLYAMSTPVVVSWEQIACMFIFIVYYIVYIAWKKHELSFLAVFLFVFFTGWKHGIVRGDSGHIVLFFKYTFLCVGIFLYFFRTKIDFYVVRCHKREVCLLSMLLLMIIWPYRDTVMPWQIAESRFYGYKQSWQLLNDKLPADGRTLRLADSFLTQIGSERFTVYPWELSYGYGHENFEMMPVFQAYSAYTPYLDKLDATYFFEKRPSFIVFNLDTIDNRWPLIENPQTWMKIYENYEVTDFDGHNFLLQAVEPKHFERGMATNVNVKKWDEIFLPETDEHILMSVKSRLSLWGKLKKLFYKIPEVNMTATFEDGRIVSKRVLLENMSSETLIDFLLLNDRDVFEMAVNNSRHSKVKKLSFSGDGLAQYEDDMELQFIPIQVTRNYKTSFDGKFYNYPIELSVPKFSVGMGNVDVVNGIKAYSGMSVSENFIEINGWLMEDANRKACKNVFFVIDGKPYSTYRMKRYDVKDLYGKDALESGFKAYLNRTCIADGRHKIELWGETENGDFIRLEFGEMNFSH